MRVSIYFLHKRMREDEFNNIKVNNEKGLPKVEFTSTPKSEYSENGDMYLHKSAANVNQNQYSRQTQSGSTAPETTTVSGGSTSTVTTAATPIAASATASGVAATSVSVIAVASTVAIGTISVATGISVAMHDYQYKFNSLIISSNELNYSLYIDDLKLDKEKDYEFDYQKYEEEIFNNPFNLRVYNSNYDKTNEVYLLQENTGAFTGLTLGETYNIVLSESRYGGEKLYEQSFTTAPNSVFYDFYLGSGIDLISNTGYVTLDYLDELDELEDFNLQLTREEYPDINIPLNKELGRQSFSLITPDQQKVEPEVPYRFTFSYKRKDQHKIFSDGDIVFYDTSEAQSEFFEFVFDETADFVTGEFEVRLRYVDDLNIFSDFNLAFNTDLTGESPDKNINIPLQKTAITQTVNGYDYGLYYENTTYLYELSCLQNGEKVILESDTVTFTDSHERTSEFKSFIFDKKANFETGDFDVRLNYVDDYNIYSDFILSFTQNSSAAYFEPVEIALEKTTETQTLNAFEYSMDFKVIYNYSLSCKKEGVITTLDEGTVLFTDYLDRESKFNEFIFDKTANFETGEFDVQLDFIDDYNIFSNFELVFVDEMQYTANIDLEKTTAVQTISGFEYGLDFYQTTYTYELRVNQSGDTVVLDSGEVKFTDSLGRESKFNQFIFDKTANFKERTFVVQLDYVDDFSAFNDFVLTFFMGPDDEDGLQVPLTATTAEQTIECDVYDIALSFDEYTYTLTALYYGDKTTLDSGSVQFTDNSGAIVQFNGLIFNKEINFDTRELILQLDYTDDLDYLYGFKFTLTDLETSEVLELNLDATTEAQSFFVDETTGVDEDTGEPIYRLDAVHHQMSYSFEYYNVAEKIVVVDGEEFYFKNSLKSTFTNLETTFDFMPEPSGSSYYMPFKFTFDDAAHEYTYFNVEVRNGDQEVVAYFVFEGDNVVEDWQIGTIRYADEDNTDIYTLVNRSEDLYLVVSITLPETPDYPMGQEVILYNEEELFTMNQTDPIILGGKVRNTEMYYGSYQIDVQPVFVGEPRNFECDVIVETKTGKTYTVNLAMPSFGGYNTVELYNALGFVEEEIEEDLEGGVKISLRYRTVLYASPSHPEIDDDNPVYSDYTTLVLYENYVFTLVA